MTTPANVTSVAAMIGPCLLQMALATMVIKKRGDVNNEDMIAAVEGLATPAELLTWEDLELLFQQTLQQCLAKLEAK